MSAQTQDKYIVRLPDGMRDEIKAAALLNERSMNAEIVARLTGTQANLRDQFAMAALTGIADHFDLSKGDQFAKASQLVISRLCYDYADAMLAAREGGDTS